jgi:periplasmic protein CpxP/Spy
MIMSDPTAASSNTPDPNQPADQSGKSNTYGRRGHRRRRWVLVGTALVIGLIGFGAGRASSGHWHGFGMHQQLDGEAIIRRAESGINRVLSRVDGTPEQKAKIADIAKAAIKDLAPIRETFRGSRDKLTAALKAEKVDRAAIEQLRTEQLALGETASKRAMQALTDAAEVLTPAQRAALIDRWQRRSWRG